jgi:hypothetical protein
MIDGVWYGDYGVAASALTVDRPYRPYVDKVRAAAWHSLTTREVKDVRALAGAVANATAEREFLVAAIPKPDLAWQVWFAAESEVLGRSLPCKRLWFDLIQVA